MERVNDLARKSAWLVGLILASLVMAPAPDAGAAERLAVKVNIANIRSGPGKKYDTIWNVEQYHPLVVLKKQGEWYLFRDFENDQGWIHKSLVDKIPTVITKKAKCNVRTGPSTKHGIAFSMDEKGIPFKVIGKKGKWLHIQHSDGDKGWIYNTLVW